MVRTVIHLLTEAIPQIVVAQHHYGLVANVEAEYALATGVETIAVDEGEDSLRLCHDCARCR